MVRKATGEDAEAIARVLGTSWHGTYRGLMPDPVIDGLTVGRRTEQWHGILAEPGVRTAALVAEHDDEVVGMVHAGPTRDPDLEPARVGEIYAIYVLPEHWGHGHGKDLMVAALDSMHGAGFSEAVLWVLDTNEIGRGFYDRGGWHLDGAIKVDDSFGAPLNEVRYHIDIPGVATGPAPNTRST